MTGTAESDCQVEVTGRVTWVGPRRRRVRVGAFSCRHCRTEILEAQPEAESDLHYPAVCHSEQGGCGVDGYVEGFDFLNQHSTHEECQQLRLESPPSGARWTVVLTGERAVGVVRGARISVRGRVVLCPSHAETAEEGRLLIGDRVSRANTPVQ
jgi:DNA replicative helicase MCM subunit Mcm2 (Cdc46/Mcm family)